jgi:hypothetical protein
MKDQDWRLEGHRNCCLLSFQDPGQESAYRSMRASKILSFFPRVVIIALSVGVILRRCQLIVDAWYNISVSSVASEVKLLCLSIVSLGLELLITYWNRIRVFRGMPLVLVLCYAAADASITYYQSRVRDEPVYPFT